MNKPLTPEEAKNLTFPCLLEVWDGNISDRAGIYGLVTGLTITGRFQTISSSWKNAALPSPEIAEAMRKQFAPKSEYPKRMLVWDDEESKAEPRIVLADLVEKTRRRYIVVSGAYEPEFKNGTSFFCIPYKNAKPIPEPEQIAQEIAELRQRLAELEAKHNQQS